MADLKSSYDLIVVGGGPAGYTAAIYGIRASLSTLLIAGEKAGGQLMLTTDVEDYPGFPKGIQGPELMKLFRDQALNLGVDIINENVTKADVKGKTKYLWADNKKYSAKVVILSTGASAKWLGLKDIKGRVKAGNEIQQALKSIFAIAENYPQLRANENFLQLQQELSAIEDKVAYARQYYNDSILS